jgi:hypothetical protein
VVIATFGGAVVLVLGLHLKGRLIARRRRAQAAARDPAPQEACPRIDKRLEGTTGPIFHGLRVVELASYVAGPTSGRVLAELGAEVVHVEEPRGDNWRYTLLPIEKRIVPNLTKGSMFEVRFFYKACAPEQVLCYAA